MPKKHTKKRTDTCIHAYRHARIHAYMEFAQAPCYVRLFDPPWRQRGSWSWWSVVAVVSRLAFHIGECFGGQIHQTKTNICNCLGQIHSASHNLAAFWHMAYVGCFSRVAEVERLKRFLLQPLQNKCWRTWAFCADFVSAPTQFRDFPLGCFAHCNHFKQLDITVFSRVVAETNALRLMHGTGFGDLCAGTRSGEKHMGWRTKSDAFDAAVLRITWIDL